MLEYHDTEIHTKLYGKDVDLCIQVVLEYASHNKVKFGNSKIHYAQHLYPERYPDGEIVLTYNAKNMKKTPTQIMNCLLGFYAKALEHIAGAPTFIPNEMFNVFVYPSEQWDKPYFRFQRNDWEEYVNKTISFKYGFAWAIYDMLKGKPIDEVKAKYGEKFVSEIKGVPNTPFESTTIEELKKQLSVLTKTHWEKYNKIKADREEAIAKTVDKYDKMEKDENGAFERERDSIRFQLKELGATSDY